MGEGKKRKQGKFASDLKREELIAFYYLTQ